MMFRALIVFVLAAICAHAQPVGAQRVSDVARVGSINGALSAVADPTEWASDEAGLGAGAGTFQTQGKLFINARGGSGTKTYSWSNIGGDASLSAASPASATTKIQFSCTPGATVTGTLRCTVTDSTGSVDVDVAVTITTYPGPIP